MICAPERIPEMFRRARDVKTLLLDVDGVLTPGQIVHSESGHMLKFFNALDGFGIKLARFAGLRIGIISASESDAIRHRAADMKIELLYLGRYDKLNAYESLKQELGIGDGEIAYVGDDIPDLPVLRRAGFPVAVHNASRPVKAAAGFLTRRGGGQGAVREVIDFILHAQDRLEEMVEAIQEHL